MTSSADLHNRQNRLLYCNLLRRFQMATPVLDSGRIEASPTPRSDGADHDNSVEIGQRIGQTLLNGIPPVKEPYVKLIVTFFENARHKPGDVQNRLRSSTTPAEKDFIRILNVLAPKSSFKRYSTSFPAPSITQSIYMSSAPFLLEDWSVLRHDSTIKDFEHLYDVEVIIDQYRSSTTSLTPDRPLKLALFDMDSTLIDQEVIDELARTVGVSEAVSAITARAMNGDIDFAASLKARVAMLKGVKTTVWKELKGVITIAEGARELIAGLKKRGIYTAVASGGFTPMADWLKEELGLDIAVANHLLVEEPTEEFPYPHLSGQLDPAYPIVTPELKRATLLSLAAARSVPLHETLAVGDGSNDLLMLGAAGLGIAWRAKEKVQVAAPMRLNGKSLADLLYLFGPEESANGVQEESGPN